MKATVPRAIDVALMGLERGFADGAAPSRAARQDRVTLELGA